MPQTAIRGDKKVERKIISVSGKRQITIPQKYFDALGFDNEAECVLQNGGILIRPIQDRSGSDFAEHILADLISQGYAGDELMARFKAENKKIRPAVQSMIAEADKLAESGEGKFSLDELFGTEE